MCCFLPKHRPFQAIHSNHLIQNYFQHVTKSLIGGIGTKFLR